MGGREEGRTAVMVRAEGRGEVSSRSNVLSQVDAAEGSLWAVRAGEGAGSSSCLCTSSGFLPPEALLASVSYGGQL